MPDPAPETDRALLDRLLPGWGLVRRDFNCVRVESDEFIGCTSDSTHTAIGAAAGALRGILARDRETRGEAEPETPRLRRVPVQMATVVSGNEIYVVTLANDGTMWETDFPMHECKWCRGSPLPQPGEDGGE